METLTLGNAVAEVLDLGVIRIATSANLPRPHVAILGGVHGCEPCGVRAIHRIASELAAGQLELAAGTLYLVHGNPKAHEEGKRHTLGGVDLNRQFDFRFVTEIPAELWVYEHQRALSLRPVLETVDVLLDLHSMSVPTPAFAIASPVPESQALADALGLAYLTTGWENFSGDCTTQTLLTRRDLPAVAVECGQNGDPADEVAYLCSRRVLDYVGVVTCDAPRPTRMATRLQMRAVIKRPSPSFRFARAFSNMQKLAAGDVIGQDDDTTIAARHDCYIIAPSPGARVGEEMLYIATAAPPLEAGA